MGITCNRLCMSECRKRRVFTSLFLLNREASTADVALECRLTNGFFFMSFPLSWGQNLSSDVAFDDTRSKRFKKKKSLCCITCVSFAFFSNIMQFGFQRADPVWYQRRNSWMLQLALKTSFSEMIERYYPSFLSLLLYLAALSLCIERARALKALEQMPLNSKWCCIFKLRSFVCMLSGELRYDIKTFNTDAWLYPHFQRK